MTGASVGCVEQHLPDPDAEPIAIDIGDGSMAELRIESGDRHVDGGLGRRRRVAGAQGAAQRVECSVHASSACAKWSTATSTMRPPLNAMNWLATVSTRCPAHVNVLVTGSRVISARAGLPTLVAQLDHLGEL